MCAGAAFVRRAERIILGSAVRTNVIEAYERQRWPDGKIPGGKGLTTYAPRYWPRPIPTCRGAVIRWPVSTAINMAVSIATAQKL